MGLRTKLFVPVIGAMGLLLLSFLVVFLRAQAQARATVAAEEARQARDALREAIEGNTRTMESVLHVLAMDGRLLAAFRAGDRVMPKLGGLEAIKRILAFSPETTVIDIDSFAVQPTG